MSAKTFSVDIWGHHCDEPGYQQPVQFPFEVDTTNGDSGTTYIRYLDRNITSIHRITVTEGESRTAIVRKIAFGSWADRETLDYLPPENYPQNIFLVEDEESGSSPESGSESGSAPESSGGPESGSATEPESGSAPDSNSAPDSGSIE